MLCVCVCVCVCVCLSVSGAFGHFLLLCLIKDYQK